MVMNASPTGVWVWYVTPSIAMGREITGLFAIAGAGLTSSFFLACAEPSSEDLRLAEASSTLEYSYLINIHQAKNTLPNVLGNITGTFNQDGELKSGLLSSSLNGSRIELRLPKFDMGFVKQISTKMSEEASVGGNLTHYSASINLVDGQQEYDIQDIIASASTAGGVSWAGLVDNKKVTIRRVYYKSARAMWRMYAYGAGNLMGNLSSYGQYADDSTFEVVPAWQNILQSMAYETNFNVRTSHYSYEIRNNKLRIFPVARTGLDKKMWIEFTIPQDNAFELGEGTNGSAASLTTTGVTGINNANTLPFANIPYDSINSIGKQWIRKYALALTKEILGNTRSKFSVVPIPGENITLNGPALLEQAKSEQQILKEELKTILDETTYDKLATITADMTDKAQNVLNKIPLALYVG